MEQGSLESTSKRTGVTMKFEFRDTLYSQGVKQFKKCRPDVGKMSTENGKVSMVLGAYLGTHLGLDSSALKKRILHDASIDVFATMLIYCFYWFPEAHKRITEIEHRLSTLPQQMLLLVDPSKQEHPCKEPGCRKNATYGPATAIPTQNNASVLHSIHLSAKPLYCKNHAEQHQKKEGAMWDAISPLCGKMGDCCGKYLFFHHVVTCVLFFMLC